MAKQRKAVASCCKGFEAFEGFKLKTCQTAVSKHTRNSLWRFGSARYSNFKAQQKQLVGPREDPWQSSERPSKAAARVLRVLRVLRGAENVPDSSFEAQ